MNRLADINAALDAFNKASAHVWQVMEKMPHDDNGRKAFEDALRAANDAGDRLVEALRPKLVVVDRRV